MHNPPPVSDASPDDSSAVPAGAHPPIFAGAVVAPTHASTWPSVIGVLSMVLGSLAVLNAVWAVAWGLLGPIFLDALGVSNDPQVAATSQYTREWEPFIVISSLLAMGLGCFLIVAGFRLYGRRASGARFSIQWAWAKIAYSFLATIVTAIMMFAQIETTKQQMTAQGAPPLVSSFMSASVYLSLGFSLVWLMVYPVFTLIWFKRAGVRSTVATWSD